MVTRFLLISVVCSLLLHAEPLVQKTDHAELASLSSEIRKTSGTYFEAEMEMRTILYTGSSTIQSDFAWKIYQNPDNIVRIELVSGTQRSGISEGRDVHIIDYENERIILYDKGGTIAFRRKVQASDTVRPAPSATKLGDMIILGYRCAGSLDTIEPARGPLTMTVETWFPSDSPFKTPLLVIRRGVMPHGLLSSLSITTVTSTRTTDRLDPGLFQVPSSYRIVDFDYTK